MLVAMVALTMVVLALLGYSALEDLDELEAEVDRGAGGTVQGL